MEDSVRAQLHGHRFRVLLSRELPQAGRGRLRLAQLGDVGLHGCNLALELLQNVGQDVRGLVCVCPSVSWIRRRSVYCVRKVRYPAILTIMRTSSADRWAGLLRLATSIARKTCCQGVRVLRLVPGRRQDRVVNPGHIAALTRASRCWRAFGLQGPRNFVGSSMSGSSLPRYVIVDSFPLRTGCGASLCCVHCKVQVVSKARREDGK